MYMDQEIITVDDDFSFDDFLSEDTKEALSKDTPSLQTKEDVKVDSSNTQKEEKPAEKVEEKVETPAKETETKEEVLDSETDAPVRAPSEPDWKYEYRLEIYQKQQQLKTAPTEEEKKEIKEEITSIRKNMAQSSREEKKAEKYDPYGVREEYDEDTFDKDRQRVEVLGHEAGFVRREDIAKLVAEERKIEKEIETIDTAEAEFLSRHPEYRDKSKYDDFVSFVGENFILQGKSRAAVNNILETAHEWRNPKSIEKKIAEATQLEKTMEAVDFSGSSATESVDKSKEQTKGLVEKLKNKSGSDYSWILD